MPRDANTAEGLIYILLPVHNRKEITRRFIDCLVRQSDRAFHLVLIDDGSSDGTAEMARDAVPDLTVLQGHGDWWWAGSLQQGFEWLRARPDASAADLVLIINDDTQFEPGFLAAGRAALVEAPRSLVLAQLWSQAGEFLEAGIDFDWRRLRFDSVRDAARANCFSTRGLFLRRDDFLALGGFHPRLLPHYASDYEFTMRARRRGFRLVSAPALRLTCDPSSTGDRYVRAANLREFLGRSFSKRASQNPVYWSSFVLLASPALWIVPNLLRIWVGFFRQALAAASGSPSKPV